MFESSIQGSPCIEPYLDMTMNQRRHLAVSKLIKKHQISSLIELGCATGELIQRVSRHAEVNLVVGVDIDEKVLEQAQGVVYPESSQDTIQWDREHDQNVWLFQGDVTKRYTQLKAFGSQLVAMVDVIEHLQFEMIEPAMANIMGYLRPRYVFISTPNSEYNVHFNNKNMKFRHDDHKFEWNRQEFKDFCEKYSNKYGYSYEIDGVGEHPKDKAKGKCTQYAIFSCRAPLQPLEEAHQGCEVKTVKHFQNLCWRSNLREIMLNYFYQLTYQRGTVSFERTIEYLKEQTLGGYLADIDVKFVKDSLEEHQKIFEFDEDGFRRAGELSEDESSEMMPEGNEEEVVKSTMESDQFGEPREFIVSSEAASHSPSISASASPAIGQEQLLEEKKEGFGVEYDDIGDDW